VREVLPTPQTTEATLLATAAALEQAASHPLAEAIRRAARSRGLTLPAAEAIGVDPGRGVRGRVGEEDAVLGTPAHLASHGLIADPAALAALSERARTVVAVARGGRMLGLIGLADRVRPGTASAIARLHALGIEVVMLTGDNAPTAHQVAAAVDIQQVQHSQLPADKAREISRRHAQGRVTAMVGDGVNDAPALAAADVSFALGAGTAVAIQAADVTLMRSDLGAVADAVELSRATLAKVRQNLIFAFGYNVLGIPLAAAGMLDPVIAGAAMAMSSVSVVTNSLRLRRWRPAAARPGPAAAATEVHPKETAWTASR
jgi:Cu+-exporting ATPase